MTLIFLSLAFVAGILLGSISHLPPWSPVLALVPLPLLIARKRRRLIIMTGLCLLAFTGGALRYRSSLPIFDENHISHYNDTSPVSFTGTINIPPEIRGYTARITLEARDITVSGTSKTVSGRVLVFASRYPEYRYSDVLKVDGQLATPSQLGDFDYQGYLADRGIYSTISYPEISVTGSGKGFKPLGWVYAARDLLAEKLAAVLPEPQASLAQGIVLGMRGNIPQSVNEDFSRTGTAHILAISGQNLSIVGGMLVATGLWLFGKRRYLYIWLALAGIWLYSLLTGMNPPVVRSAIMVSVFLGADLAGRQKNALTALMFAAALMIAFDPQLPWDASFQLSFLATFGLVVISPRFQDIARKFTGQKLGEEGWQVSITNWVTDNLAVTIGVLLLVWPLIAYYFNTFSIIAPLSTLVLVPLLPAIIVTGALAAVLALWFTPLGWVTGWLAWLFLSVMLWVIRLGASLPAAALNTGEISPALVWGYYALVGVALVAFFYRENVTAWFSRAVDFISGPVRRWLIPALFVTALLSTFIVLSMPDDRTRVRFLDVGQGDAILIQRGNQDILIDGGPDPQTIALELSRWMPFWDRTIELVILTHPHADHLNGLMEVLKRYRVPRVVYPPADSDAPSWLAWQELLKEKAPTVIIAQDGRHIEAGNGLEIEIFAAPDPEKEMLLDAGGLVIRVTQGKISFLLTSDITAEIEMGLVMQRSHLKSTVLKVAHHGASTSTTPEFLSVVSPSVAVISVGEKNTYGHPHQEVMTRLLEAVSADNIFRTDLDGTVTFTTNGERLWVSKNK